MPEFATLADLNGFMAACEDRDDHRVISARPVTVGAAAAAETPELLALPADVFEAGPTVSVKANHKAEVCVRQCYYSVPVTYAGRRVSVRVGAALIEVFADGKRNAAHVRAVHKYAHVLELDHYLEVLTRKPGAMAGSTALVAARASGAFTATHQRFWDKARHQLGDGAGTRALILDPAVGQPGSLGACCGPTRNELSWHISDHYPLWVEFRLTGGLDGGGGA